VHVSSLGASVDASSQWQVSKAVGERLVREEFPSATIIRPATMFGDEDRFLNRIANMTQMFPIIPLIDAETTKQQPVYCDDVAKAIVQCLGSAATKGQTIELAGPKQYTTQEIYDYVHKTIDEPSNAFNVPTPVGMALAMGVQQLPDAWLSCDQLRRESVDIVRTDGATGFEDFGMTPTAIEDIALRYLLRFRKTAMVTDTAGGKIIKAPTV